MAGKTGTARKDYANFEEWKKDKKYVSSFSGYFPAENPKYSCIVMIHEPSTKKGYYGADVTGPVFKRIAQKIFTDAPLNSDVAQINKLDEVITNDFEKFYNKSQEQYKEVPSVIGMAGMDAVSLLENLGLKVKVIGNGMVKNQSIKKGEVFIKGTAITLKLS